MHGHKPSIDNTLMYRAGTIWLTEEVNTKEKGNIWKAIDNYGSPNWIIIKIMTKSQNKGEMKYQNNKDSYTGIAIFITE